MVSHQIVYIFCNFRKLFLADFHCQQKPFKKWDATHLHDLRFWNGMQPPCVGSAYIWSMEIPLTDYTGRCLHIYIHVYKSKNPSLKYHVPTFLRSLRSLRPWGPLYFCRKSYTSFWIPFLVVGKKPNKEFSAGRTMASLQMIGH